MDPRGAYAYEVAAECSGIHSLIALLALTTIYGFITFSRLWKQLLVVCLAGPLALVNNVFRLVSIMIAAEAFGPKAGKFVHEWFGFVTFAMALGLLLAVGHWLGEPRLAKAPPGGATADETV
jgi:exosortase/archaeosortase family protein